MSSNFKASLQQIDDYYNQLAKAKKSTVVVGLPRGVSGVYSGGDSVIDIGARHEYGLGVPVRSFLRAPFFVRKKEMQKFIRNEFKKVVDGEKADKALELIGVFGRNIVIDSFDSRGFGQWEKLGEKTIKEKGSSAPLIEGGTLKGSITYEVRGID